MATSIPPSYHSLTTTNAVPTSHEATVVQQQVEDLERQHRQLSELLAHTQSRIQEVTNQLGLLKPVLSSIRRLPLEILGEIFLRVIPTSKMRPSSYQKALTKLTLVCKSWRDAAYLTPRLWCNLWVRADAPSLSFEYLKAWTSRAGRIPKNLEISLSNCGGVSWKESSSTRRGGINTDLCAGTHCLFANRAFAKLLKQTPGVWNAVTLKPPTSNCLRKFVSMMERTGPTVDTAAWNYIQSFTLLASEWRRWLAQEGLDHRLLSNLSFIPTSITSLHLSLPDVGGKGVWDQDLHIPPAVLERLTSLELQFQAHEIESTLHLFSALGHCQSVHTLKIDFSNALVLWDEALEEFEQNGLVLPKLECLHFRQLRGESMWSLHLLKMPILREMSLSFGLDGTIGDPEWQTTAFSVSPEEEVEEVNDIYPLARFIRGNRDSASQLQSLFLKGLKFYDGALFDILHGLDSLAHLRLDWTQTFGDCTDFLDLMDGEPPCVPKLKTLEILNHRILLGYDVPYLRPFVAEQGIDLTLSHDWCRKPLTWRRKDTKHYRALIDLPSESEDER